MDLRFGNKHLYPESQLVILHWVKIKNEIICKPGMVSHASDPSDGEMGRDETQLRSALAAYGVGGQL